MARVDGDFNSADTQFSIMYVDNLFLDERYTVWGQVSICRVQTSHRVCHSTAMTLSCYDDSLQPSQISYQESTGASRHGTH